LDETRTTGEGLTLSALRGVQWSSVATGTNIVLQIGFTAVMARLLDPETYGLIAIANVVVRCGTYFAQMGIGQAIVQARSLNQKVIGSGFTASIGFGITFCALVQLIASPAAIFFGDERLEPVVRWLSLSFVTSAIGSTSVALLKRKLDFKSIARIDIASYAIGYGCTGAILAMSGFGVWSLVCASLGQSFLASIMAYLRERHPLRLSFDWRSYQPFLMFGGTVSIISFLEFAGSSLDSAAIGFFEGTSSLGIYNRSFMLVYLPAYAFTTSVSRVLFPLFSKIQSDKNRLADGFLSSLSLVSVVIVPACFGMAICAKEIVVSVLGDNWFACVELLPILSLVILFRMVSHLGGVLCDATANLARKVWLQVGYLVTLSVSFGLMRGYGLKGFALALLLTESGLFIGYTFAVRSVLSIQLRAILHPYLLSTRIGILSAGAIGAALLVLNMFPVHMTIRLVIAMVIGAATLGVQLLVVPSKAVAMLFERVTSVNFRNSSLGSRLHAIIDVVR